MSYSIVTMISAQGQIRQPSRLSSVPRDPSFRLNLTAASVRSASGIPLHVAQSAASEVTVHEDNYRLTRMGTRDSWSSEFSDQSVYRVALDFSSLEIAQVQYTWTRMLVEEEMPHEIDTELSSVPGLMKKRKAAVPQLAVQALSTFCTQLYLNLLAMDPGLEKAFPLIRHQALSMAGVMSLAVASLDNLLSLDSYLEQLAKRHLRILGIEPFQFEMMGEALIQAFVQRFGSKFTQELQVLWIKFYMYLANTLLQFGLDPVLRLGPSELAPVAPPYLQTLRLGSLISADLMLMLSSARRGSYSTGFTEALLVREEKAPVVKPHTLPAPKKRLRLRKRGGDCVIV